MSYIGNTNTTQAFTPAIDYFSGNGSTTAFTLSRPVASVAQVQVVVNNVAQNPSSAYTVSSNTITFTSAPSSGTNNIYVYYTSPITQVIAPGQGTVTATSMASSTGTGAGVFQTSPTITTPTISSLSSASATALTLQSAGTTAVTIDTSQNVGIGTSSIATIDSTGKTLEIYGGAGGGFIHMTNSTTGQTVGDGFIIGTSIGGSDALLVQRESANMIFRTADTERMRINSGGQVNVNTTGNTDALLVVNGGGNHAIRTLRDGTANATQISFANANGTVGSITTSGSATAYNTSSDYRLKENITPMTGALAKVALLKPVTYKWKIDGADGEGFIAHELAEVCPHAVSGEKDAVDDNGGIKPQGIDVSFLVATLTAAIQELSAKNDALTARIEALENR